MFGLVEEASNRGVWGLWEVCAERKGKGKGKGREEERVGAFRESEEESVEKRRKARLRSFGVAWRPRGWSFCFARRSVHRC